MKLLKFLTALFLLAFSSLVFASGGESVRLLYSTATVTGAAWVPLVNTTARYTAAVFFSNSSLDPLGLGIVAANSPAGSEVQVAIIPAGGTAAFPIQIPASSRVSVISLGRALSSGELDLTLVHY